MDRSKPLRGGLTRSQLIRHLEADVKEARKWAATPVGKATLKRRKIESDLAWKDWLQERRKLREERLSADRKTEKTKDIPEAGGSETMQLKQSQKSQRKQNLRQSSRLQKLRKTQYDESNSEEFPENDDGSNDNIVDAENDVSQAQELQELAEEDENEALSETGNAEDDFEESDSDDTNDEDRNAYEREEFEELKKWVEVDGDGEEEDPFAHSSHEYYAKKGQRSSIELDYAEEADDEMEDASDFSDSEDGEYSLLPITDEEVAEL